MPIILSIVVYYTQTHRLYAYRDSYCLWLYLYSHRVGFPLSYFTSITRLLRQSQSTHTQRDISGTDTPRASFESASRVSNIYFHHLFILGNFIYTQHFLIYKNSFHFVLLNSYRKRYNYYEFKHKNLNHFQIIY